MKLPEAKPIMMYVMTFASTVRVQVRQLTILLAKAPHQLTIGVVMPHALGVSILGSVKLEAGLFLLALSLAFGGTDGAGHAICQPISRQLRVRSRDGERERGAIAQRELDLAALQRSRAAARRGLLGRRRHDARKSGRRFAGGAGHVGMRRCREVVTTRKDHAERALREG